MLLNLLNLYRMDLLFFLKDLRVYIKDKLTDLEDAEFKVTFKSCKKVANSFKCKWLAQILQDLFSDFESLYSIID